MHILCSKCRQRISVDDLNIDSDKALCRPCGEVFSISQLIDEGYDAEELLTKPAGISLALTPHGWRVAATTRSANFFLFAMFTVFFGPVAVTGMIGQQIQKGQFNPLAALLAVTFLLVSCFSFVMAAMHSFGQVVVSREGDEGEVFTGVGSLGWRRRFLWTGVKSVLQDPMPYQQSGSSNLGIRLVGPDILFGSLLRDNRRRFVLDLLRRLRIATQDESARLYDQTAEPLAGQMARL